MVVMKKSIRKNLLREIKNSKSRFLSIFVIIAIGVAFFAGIRATSPDMKTTADQYLDTHHLADLSVLAATGFTGKDMEKVKEVQGVAEVVPGYTFDALAVSGGEEKPVKVHSFNINEQRINQPELLEGNLPGNEDECLTEKGYLKSEKLKIGDSVELKTANGVKRFKIVGAVNSPLYISQYERGNNSLGNGKTVAFFHIGEKSAAELAIPALPGVDKTKIYNELLIRVEGAKEKNAFLDEYKDVVNPVKERVENLGKTDKGQGWYVFDRSHNAGVSGFRNDTDRIGAIGTVFPLLFFLVAALVCLTSMTRMVEEHRVQIGTLKALGYGKAAIVSQYFLYSFAASIGGSIVGTLVGFQLFPTVIFNAYRIMYALPATVIPFHMDLAVTSTLVAVLCTTIAAVFACIKELVVVPAVLMRPKAPKAGKRIFLERVGFIWKRLSFTGKVTARNILRYKKRFFMTIVGIAGCTGLLLTGFGLKNSILSITDLQFNSIYAYNMMAFLNQPVEGDAAKRLKEGIKQYGEINSSLLLFQQSVSVNKEGSGRSEGSAYITVPENKDLLNHFIDLRMKGTKIPLSDEGIVITEKFSKLFAIQKGDTIEITRGGKTVAPKVLSITEQYVGHYIYMSPGYYEELFGEPVKYNGFTAILKNTDKDTEKALSTNLMKNKSINSVNFTTGISSDFQKSMDSMNSVIWVLILSAAALAFVVMYNLTSININERIRELATIKVLGFYDREVAAYIYRENILLSILGTLAGLLLGIGLHRYVVVTTEIDLIMFVRAIKPLSFVYSAVLTVVFAGLVNVVMFGRLKKINMVESLKSAE